MSDVLHNHQHLQERAAAAIRRLAEIASDRGSRVTIRERTLNRADVLRAAADRLQHNQFTLAVVGEFSRGKSSLINAMLDAPDLLPTSIKPSTAAITVLQYAPDPPRASVLFRDGSVRENLPLECLREYCCASGLDGSALHPPLGSTLARMRTGGLTEDAAIQEMERQVREALPLPAVHQVNVWYPSPLLADGVVLVDTPGIGSVNPEHGEATRAFIHKADAVIFLINTDPVISASECNFLTFLQDYTSRFLFVVTKTDRFDEAERRESMAYTREVIREFTGIADPPIFPVSAKRYMEARAAGSEEGMRESGLPQFLSALQLFLIRERGHAFIREHVMTALTHLNELRSATEMELEAMRLTRTDLQQRLQATQPGLAMARQARDRILERLDHELAQIPEALGGEADILWIRLSASLREAVEAEIDRYGWDELRHAAELIPITVRDALSAALNERLNQIATHLALVRRRTISECRQVMDTMASRVEFRVPSLQPPCELELHLDFDPSSFVSELRRVGTITIGSTLALSVGSALLFGGVGAVVMLGGVLAGTGLTSMLKGRVKNELRQALSDPLSTLIDSVRRNLIEEARRHLAHFRDDVEQALTGAISNVDDTLQQLESQAAQESFGATEQEQALLARQSELADLSRELALLLGPGV